jgi:hypothetical protein
VSKLPIHRAAKPKITDKITRGLKQLPQVVIIRPWRGYAVGAVIQPPGVLRDVLLQQKFAKLVVAKKPVHVKAKTPRIETDPKETEVKKPAVKKPEAKKAEPEKTEDK